VVLACVVAVAAAVELTFELPDNAKECFHEEIKEGVESNLEFQVVTGGQYDVDVMLTDPQNQELYKVVKEQYGSFQFKPKMTGIYKVCFSNEFSTFSHKLVYMDFQVGEETMSHVEGQAEHIGAMTLMETLTSKIFSSLNSVIDYQTHNRLQEAGGRKRAEEINETVLYWAVIESATIIAVSVFQVFILKGLFVDRQAVRVG